MRIFLILLVFFFPATARAAPPPPVHRDLAGNLLIWGEVPPALELLDYDSPYSRSLRANRCGVIRVSPTAAQSEIGATLQIQGGQPLAIASFPELPAAPSCRGNQLQPPQYQNFQVQGSLYLVGLAPGVRYTIAFPDVPTRRLLRPNSCGFYRVPNPPRNFGLMGSDYSFEELAIALPLLCQGGNLYRPDSWD